MTDKEILVDCIIELANQISLLNPGASETMAGLIENVSKIME